MNFRCSVEDLAEITRWILSFGAECTVLQPPELAGRVCDVARGMLARNQAAHL